MTKYTSPLTIPVGKKNFSLNLNCYRNAHYHVLNNAKVNYKELISVQFDLKDKFDLIGITYTLYPKTKRLTDISNVLSVVDKFFCDAFVLRFANSTA